MIDFEDPVTELHGTFTSRSIPATSPGINYWAIMEKTVTHLV